MPRLDSFLRRLALLQHQRALWIVALSFALAAAALPVVKGLGLRSDWVDLLPTDAPRVRDLHAGEGRVGSLATLTLVVEGPDAPAMERYATALAPRLEALPSSYGLRKVEWNLRAFQDFVRAHKELYAPLDTLIEFRDGLRDRIAWERNRANPLYVDLDDAPPPDPRAILERLRDRVEHGDGTARRFRDGYYLHPGGRHLMMFLRADIPGGDASRGAALLQVVRAEVDAVRRDQGGAVQVEFAGDLPVAVEEHDAIQRELVTATVFTIVLCVAVIYLLFRRPRAALQLGGAMLLPVLATFAFARVTVGHLNTSTAFLGSIVIGNGINPGIVWLARYFEERRRGAPVDEAIAATHRGAWAGTFTASLAASLSYGSLMFTAFRGFRDFGIIGGAGMMICWALTMLLLPSFASAWERLRPLESVEHGVAGVNPFGRVFSFVARKVPRTVLAVTVLLAVAGTVAGVVALARDPREYDFRRLSSERPATRRGSELTDLIEATLGQKDAGNAIAVLLDRREDVPRFRAELDRRRTQEHAPWGVVHSLDDMLPSDQPAKIALVAEIRSLLLEARGHATGDTLRDIDEHMPPEHVAPLADADLPESVAALYTERDGTRGRLFFVEEQARVDTWDGRYLVRWAEALRAVRLPDGTRGLVVGRAPVFADMISAIYRDGPRAVAASLLATALLLGFAFRRGRDRVITLGTLLVGVAWFAGCLAAFRIRLNFLNFVALPITFGIGADYAVNIMRRYVQESVDDPANAVRRAVEETGGAVVVCSLTTIFGYSSLLTSANKALNSFGLAAVLGEVTCVLCGVLALPAFLMLRAKLRGDDKPSLSPPPA